MSKGGRRRLGTWLWLQLCGVIGLIGTIIASMMEGMITSLLFITFSLLFPHGQVHWVARKRFVCDRFSSASRPRTTQDLEPHCWMDFWDPRDQYFVFTLDLWLGGVCCNSLRGAFFMFCVVPLCGFCEQVSSYIWDPWYVIGIVLWWYYSIFL